MRVKPVYVGARKSFVGKILVFVLVLHLGNSLADSLGSLVGEPKTLEGLIAHIKRACVHNAKTNDDLTLAIGVSRIYDAINVLTTAKIFDRHKLTLNTRVNLFVGTHLELESKAVGETGKIVKSPACRGGTARVILNIAQRKKVTERPRNNVAATLKITVFTSERAARHLLYSLNDISRQAWLFGNDNSHFLLLRARFQTSIFYHNSRPLSTANDKEKVYLIL